MKFLNKLIALPLIAVYYLNFMVPNSLAMLEELDLDGTSLNVHPQVKSRIVDDSIAQAMKGHRATVSWLCREIAHEPYQHLKRLNLSRNYIGDEGAKKLNETIIQSMLLPQLSILDLSFNDITENGIFYFSSLLKRENFRYLVIVGNRGASTIDGMYNLSDELSRDNTLSNEQVSYLLRKVIWTPQAWLDNAEKAGNINNITAKCHRYYYDYWQYHFLNEIGENHDNEVI